MWTRDTWLWSTLCVAVSALITVFLADASDWIPVIMIFICTIVTVPRGMEAVVIRRSVRRRPKYLITVYGLCLILTGLISTLFAQVSIWASQ